MNVTDMKINNENELTDEKKKTRLHNAVIIAVTVIIGILVIIFSFFLISNIITDNSISTMEELANHDKKAIASSLDNRWDTLDGIALNIRQEKCETTEELMRKLSASKHMIDCIRLTLFAENGDTINSSMKLSNSKEMLEQYKKVGVRFIYRRDNLEASVEGRNELLVMGVKITPFTVEGRTYTYLVCRMDINALQDELKIDSYDGKGYSSVIDAEGNYIVKINRNSNDGTKENFYSEVTNEGLEAGNTVENIHKQIEKKENFYITHTPENGDTCIMTFTPMDNVDWYFVMSVPISVFWRQSASIASVLAVLIITIILVGVFTSIIFIRKRTKTLAIEIQHRKKLAEALALAEQASRAKTTFLNNMSHDIRTPMNSIIGFTALATTHIDNKERVKDYLTKISRSSSHLLSLINDVLDMSRIESGNVTIEENTENIAEILHNICNIIQADIKSKQLELFVDTVDVSNENIYCDRLRLNQILLNLISNAMKFTNPGGTVSIRIIQKPCSKEGYALYEFKVKDTGIGMSPEYAQIIFEPFTRERTSTVSGIQGTGLGMAITKNIVTMMGGTIDVESEVGKGTEFTVRLELKIQDEHQESLLIEELEGIHALVVDDDLNACQSVSKMLRQIGMKADWTMYGKEAVARTVEAMEMGEKFEVYIIDWLMPDMNGIETARQIRKVVGNDAPIIILSAYDWGDIEEEAKNAGVNGFVSKPLFVSDLRTTLLKVCGKAEEPKEQESVVVNKDFEGKRILLAEDIELNREIACVILEEAGFLVECAENGKEALDMVKNSVPGRYNLILMDIQMPVMNGYDATKAIRKLENKELANIPIIAMTADTFVEDRQEAMEAGMNGHLGKPIDIALLMETLSDIFGNEEGNK